MLFSDESYKNAEACRFCWMCRHVCPVVGVTGNETWTPHARGLLISMEKRGMPFEESMAKAMYMCCLCDACATNCETGWKPSIYIREARTAAVAQGIAPAAVDEAIGKIQETGNLRGESRDAGLAAALEKLPEKAETLLYLGGTASTRCPSSALAVISLLGKAGTDFTVLKDEPDSGAFLADLMGYTGDIQKQAKKAAEAIRESGAKTLVALDPHDACIFTDKYAEWNLLPGIRVTTATAFLAQLIADGKLVPKKVELQATFHDPCKLSRGLGETDPAREILAALGVDLKEMLLNRQFGRCCGGAVLDSISPGTVKEIVRVREEDAERMGYGCIVTACPDCLELMTRYGLEGVRVQDIFELLDGNC